MLIDRLSDRDRPLNMVLSVKKYVPMGPPIIAAVKPSSLYITFLRREVIDQPGVCHGSELALTLGLLG